MHSVHKAVWTALLAGAFSGALIGCGTPGAPLPPSLDLPQAVSDLSASRVGNRVTLRWTMPRRTTDKLLLKGNITVRVCRQSAPTACETAGGEMSIAPGAEGNFTETLPATFLAGDVHPLNYFVELKNSSGRSAGPSNAAPILAGAPPAPVEGLRAVVRKEGVVLHWAAEKDNAAIRLERTLLTPPVAKPRKKSNPLAAPPEPTEQNLLVEANEAQAHRALDPAARFGQSYHYRAQRVVRKTVGGKTLELDGEFSAPVAVEVKDVFPPAVPTGLSAVASTNENGVSIDLSWLPNTESDLAGYIVYRREGEELWKRLTTQPSVGPAFHDATVEAGHSYRYAVSAIDQSNQESGRSQEAVESVPEKQ